MSFEELDKIICRYIKLVSDGAVFDGKRGR